jgi:hypothetical protein
MKKHKREPSGLYKTFNIFKGKVATQVCTYLKIHQPVDRRYVYFMHIIIPEEKN